MLWFSGAISAHGWAEGPVRAQSHSSRPSAPWQIQPEHSQFLLVESESCSGDGGNLLSAEHAVGFSAAAVMRRFDAVLTLHQLRTRVNRLSFYVLLNFFHFNNHTH